MRLKAFENPEEMSQAAAQFVLKVGERSADRQGVYRLVLSGGDTPRRVYDILAERAADHRRLWDLTEFYWGDERCVPCNDPDSNYRMAKEHLLDPIGIAPDQIHPIPADDPDREEAASAYERRFPRTPDLILLGMGADGHTASLFPGTVALNETERLVAVGEAPVEPRHRITITRPAIASARNVLVVVTGASKAPALARVFAEQGDIHETPARLVRDACWYVDLEAGAQVCESPLAGL